MRNRIKVSKAATGCTIKMDESEERVPLGSEKLASALASPNNVIASIQSSVFSAKDFPQENIRRLAWLSKAHLPM